MPLSPLLADDACVFADVKLNSKKGLLQFIASMAKEHYNLDMDAVFSTLLEREKLGTTGIGKGIAIPHGRIDAIDSIHGLFIRLARPINFDSVDEAPVDLVFALLAPAESGADHLKALSRISRALRNSETVDKLRTAKDKAALYLILAGPDKANGS